MTTYDRLPRQVRPPVGLDGIYYDGIAFGRHTMRRVRRVLEAEKGPGRALIDLHCGNNLHPQYVVATVGPSVGR